MSKTFSEDVHIIRELLKRRKQAVIEADGVWNPYDELFTDEIVEALESLCTACEQKF